jgi:hypothetical protein
VGYLCTVLHGRTCSARAGTIRYSLYGTVPYNPTTTRVLWGNVWRTSPADPTSHYFVGDANPLMLRTMERGFATLLGASTTLESRHYM